MPTRQKKAPQGARSAPTRPARTAPATSGAPSPVPAPPQGIGAVRVYLSSRELDALHQAAREKGQSPSGILRQAFRAYIGFQD
ncbi:MAG TPA: CopG family transcriptional regulator [Thermoanaerobaculia bacterium]|nr:CopG family transcriptional regulator [Thermoanaerobaculia bacterium]